MYASDRGTAEQMAQRLSLRTFLRQTGSLPMVMRGRLKHSWLENEVLNKTGEVIIELRHQGGWPELQRFPAEAEQALALSELVEFGFSPARLVDECEPLSVLSDEDRDAVRKAVHEAYLEQFDALSAAKDLRDAAQRTAAALQEMLGEWTKPTNAISDASLQTRWGAVLTEAVRLHSALEALPRGIVLP